MKLAATAGAAAALPGCEPAARKLIPYVVPDENVIPGVPSFYATTCAECPAGCGLVARVREGRVIKLEGNPVDPVSGGSICARGQAALQGLYNPDRLARPIERESDGSLSDLEWGAAEKLLDDRLKAAASAGEDRVAFLGAPAGPTLSKIVKFWLRARHSRHGVFYEPLNHDAERAAAQICFGRHDLPVYRIDRAQTLISFDADFLETWRSPVEFTRQYALFREPRRSRGRLTIGRATYVGPRLNLSASNCDEWVSVRAGDEASIAWSVLHVLLRQGWIVPDAGVDSAALVRLVSAYDPASVSTSTGVPQRTITRIAESFGKAEGALAIAGSDDRAAQVAAFVLNAATRNVGRTMLFFDDGPPNPVSSTADLNGLISAMREGRIDVLMIAGANPVFSMPPGSRFAEALGKVPFVVWCGGVPDETAARANLLLPVHHPLEDWHEGFPRAGVRGLGQPVTRQVFDSRPLGDVLISSAVAGGAKAPWKTTAEAIEAEWIETGKAAGLAANPLEFWATVRREGGIFQQPEPARVKLDLSRVATAPPGTRSSGTLGLLAFPHIFFYDGRGADKPWLQELPEPVTQFVWDAWAEIHPATARRLNVANEDVVELRTAAGAITLAAHVSDRVHPETIAVALGQGHEALGRYARDRGANPWRLLSAGRRTAPVTVRPTGAKHHLVSPLGNSDMMRRSVVETMTVEELARGRHPPPEPLAPGPYEMYAPVRYPKHRWGMTIDLNACTGCSACVTACYAENNIPVVGREAVAHGRIMSWMRIERYFPSGGRRAGGPLIEIAPMLCQQCGHAPCEPVCPVFASYHTEEGLNGQVYNRCVGTRYCENNCSYKVRRFNWFPPEWPQPLNLQLNPDVTVRGAGVMEKCTFCVQRIQYGKINAATESRPLRDGEIVPACAQACPARAITFGDVKDEESAMMQRRTDHKARGYRVLEELNTLPAITYLRGLHHRRG